jgi:hypothetical protein
VATMRSLRLSTTSRRAPTSVIASVMQNLGHIDETAKI